MSSPPNPHPRSVGVQYATGKEQISSSRKNEEAEQSRNEAQFLMLVKIKSDELNLIYLDSWA